MLNRSTAHSALPQTDTLRLPAAKLEPAVREQVVGDPATVMTALKQFFATSPGKSAQVSFREGVYVAELLNTDRLDFSRNQINNKNSEILADHRYDNGKRELFTEEFVMLFDEMRKLRDYPSIESTLTGGEALVVGTYGDLSEALVLFRRCPKAAQIRLVEIDTENFLRAVDNFQMLDDNHKERLVLECGDARLVMPPRGGFRVVFANNTFVADLYEDKKFPGEEKERKKELALAFGYMVSKLSPGGYLIGVADFVMNGPGASHFEPFRAAPEDAPMVRICGGVRKSTPGPPFAPHLE